MKKRTSGRKTPDSESRASLRPGLESFYAAPAGKLLDGEIAAYLDAAWEDGDLGRRHMMCLGFPPPVLRRKAASARSFSLLCPPFIGAVPWVEGDVSKAAVVDPSRLPLREGCFDRVLVCHAFEYLEDPLSFVEELWRALAPGGRAIFLVANKRWPWHRRGAPWQHRAVRVPVKTFCAFLRRNGLAPLKRTGCLYGLPVEFPESPKARELVRAVNRGTGLAGAGFYLLEAEKTLGSDAVKEKTPLKIAPASPITS